MWRSKPRDQQSFYQTIEDFGGLWKRDKVVCKNRKHKTESTKIVNKNKLEKMCAATNNTQYNFNHDNRQNNTDSNSNNSTNTLDKDKCEKLKRFILIVVLAVVGIIGWHIYEYFYAGKGGPDPETFVEHEIIDLTRRLFADEVSANNYPISVNFQGKTKSFARDDRAAQPLLQIDDAALSNTSSTISLLRRLFDNYVLDVHTIESTSDEQAQEELDFLNAILKTSMMKHTMRFLQQKGRVSAEHNAQLQLLKSIWFTQYSRSKGRMGSSGFEHVFLAELREESILGLHNWIYFHEQEMQGNLDYKGFIEKIELDKNKYVLATRFSFHNHVKPYNTLFIGTSPEFELSVYTVCFLLHVEEPCPVQMGKTKFNINTNAWDWHGRKTLAAAYPSLEK
ncbi:poly(U)-specific endoribonuclease homolog [Ceratitis capitata]|uniref:poly(U)-specific endoribonuclease homolog n=1 Tax=Ceratitis capitata TaxID=7213 RepID=UPI0003297678|nr:poly(U)-specific endoribonuclease homolog [Ceratitis capitata]